MKLSKIALLTSLAVAWVASGAAFAETVEGTVASLDLDAKAIEVTQKAEAGATGEKVRVSVNDATTYSGEVTALEEIIEGDLIKVEAEKDAQGNLMAKSVDVSFGEEEVAPAEEAAAPAAPAEPAKA